VNAPGFLEPTPSIPCYYCGEPAFANLYSEFPIEIDLGEVIDGSWQTTICKECLSMLELLKTTVEGLK
jgi:hypothetical protein